MSLDYRILLTSLVNGNQLSDDEYEYFFDQILNEKLDDITVSSFLTALNLVGYGDKEIYILAKLLKKHSIKIKAPDNTIDVCGTGGSGLNKLNVSTAVAIILASLDVPVAKHGNKGITSKSGSADILSELGVKIDCAPAIMKKSLKENNICFMMAPLYHPVMRNVAHIRKSLPFKTIFNIIGPIVNPTKLKFQLLGTSNDDKMYAIAKSLDKLGVESAWVVNSGNLDEISIDGFTKVVELSNKVFREFTISPSDFGVEAGSLADIVGKDPVYNAHCLMNLLNNSKETNSIYENMVLINVAAALFITGKVTSLKEGVILAKQSLLDGRALSTLKKFINLTSKEEF